MFPKNYFCWKIDLEGESHLCRDTVTHHEWRITANLPDPHTPTKEKLLQQRAQNH